MKSSKRDFNNLCAVRKHLSNAAQFLTIAFTLMVISTTSLTAATIIDSRAFTARDARSPLHRLAAFVGSSSSPQQPRRSRIGRRIGRDSSSQPDSNGGESGTPPAPSPRSSGSTRRTRGGTTRTAPRAPTTVAVTFIADAPGTEIVLTGQVIGRTGEDGRLTRPVARGIYTAVARRDGHNTLPRTIEVNARDMVFTFSLTGRTLPSVGRGSGGATTNLSAEDIINRYLDPRQTDSVTVAEWQRVLTRLNSALANDQMNTGLRAQALFATAQVAYLRRDYASALVTFGQATLASPTSPLAFYGLGNAYLATNQPEQAFEAYQQAIRLSTQQNQEMAMAYRGLGDALMRQRRYGDALRNYERARALGYSSPEMTLNIARIHLRARRWEQAMRELNELTQAAPSLEVFIGLGDAHVGMEQYQAAIAIYRRAVEIDRRSAVAHYRLGEALMETREYAAANESFERALGLDPTGALIDRGRARDLADQAAERARRAN